jgi:ubiquitin-conjugating enzyme E2 variant
MPLTLARAAKVGVVAACHGLSVAFVIRAFMGPWTWWDLALGLLAGHLLIDFITICVHWTVDNYFTPTSPVIGSTVYYFREHHEKAYEMFQRDYVEGNFRNALVSFVIQVPLVFLVTSPFGNVCLALSGLMGAYITQIHKWAHLKRPPAPVALAQRAKLLVDWRFHNAHHQDASRHYGLYAGWFDIVFDRLGVFESLERLIRRTTGTVAVETRLPSPTLPLALELSE